MIRDRIRLITVCFVAIALSAGLSFSARISADEPSVQSEPELESAPRKPVAETKQKPFKLPTQLEGDVQPFEPAHRQTTEEKARIEALSWFMSGQIKEARNEFTEAFADYEKAAKLDPNSIEIYRALVPLAFNLNKSKEAMDYAMRAIQLDPNNYLLLQKLGRQMAGVQKLDEAVRFLEQAVKSADLKKDSVDYVALHRDLAILFRELHQADKRANAYAIVFDALIHPEKYHLDFQMRAKLKADPATQFDVIGDAFFEANRPELAIQAFEKAVQASNGKPGVLSFNLAQAYFKTKRPDDALKHLQVYFDAQLQSKGREPYELLAEILKAAGKSGELIGRIETLAKADPWNSTLQYYLADQYVAADRMKEAEEIYTKSLKASANPEGYVGLAAIYRKQNRVDDLLDVLSKALKGLKEPKALDRLQGEVDAISTNEKLVDALIESGRKIAVGDSPKLNYFGSIILAKLSARGKKTEAAVEFYKYAIKSRRNQGPIIYMELGRYLFLEKQYAQAAEVFQKAASETGVDAGKPDFLLWASRSQEMAGDTKGALASLQEALKAAPDHPDLLFHEAWIFTHSRQWDEAVKRYEQINERFKQNKEIQRRCLFSISNVHVQKGDMRAGEKILEDVLAKEPDDPSVNNDLGYLYADQGKNLEQAEKMIRKAIASEPENPAYLDSMGWVLFKLGKHAEALPFLEKAASKPSGGDATIFEHLGDCYQKLQKMDKALELWKKGLDDAKEESRPDEKLIERIQGKLNQNKPQEKK